MKEESPRWDKNDRQATATDFRRFAERYWKRRTSDLEQALTRLRQLQPVIEPILRSEGVPADLLAVVLIESAARPMALSRREARGLWQFIPTTAQRYGLSVSAERDDRLNVEKATRAAAQYLRQLHLQFGDWALALAAYNAGEEAVQRAIDRAGRADFWILRRQQLLPVETRNYVPAVLAAMELLGDAGTNTRPALSGAQSVEMQVLYAWSAVGN
jgi:membrane-bound lytic murein transglycosylase D